MLAQAQIHTASLTRQEKASRGEMYRSLDAFLFLLFSALLFLLSSLLFPSLRDPLTLFLNLPCWSSRRICTLTNADADEQPPRRDDNPSRRTKSREATAYLRVDRSAILTRLPGLNIRRCHTLSNHASHRVLRERFGLEPANESISETAHGKSTVNNRDPADLRNYLAR